MSPWVLSLVFVGLGVPLALRRVPPNSLYGFRTPKTMSDPGLWYRVNAYAGRALVLAGVSVSVLTLCWSVLIRRRLVSAGLTEVVAVLLDLLPVLIAMALTWRALTKMSFR